MYMIETVGGTTLQIDAIHGSTVHNAVGVASVSDGNTAVAAVVVYTDGSAATTWQSTDGLYGMRPKDWWDALCGSVAAVVREHA